MIPRRSLRLLLVTLLLAAGPAALPAQDVPTPESFFGFPVGADRKLARWDRMVEYYRLLGEASPRLQVVEMGPSTMGNPFLALFVSSPENLARLDELQRLNATLSDPRGVSDAEIEEAIARGKAVVVESMGLHATEVASSQMAVELVWDMVTRDDPEMARILDETVAILIPSFNPDGEIMVVDWYRRTVGTAYEGSGLPWLYHKYIG
ncbi:MAG TPA: M14 family zinc carboxypeptidase, partial [Longimicrobiales bacterium]|nr:M14 family zinc carboxypeptidase [Longimicrobiales bacterium]